MTQVSGGLLRAPNGFGPKDHERAGVGSRTYDGGGRSGYPGGAGVSIPGDAPSPENVSSPSAWLLWSPARGPPLGSGISVEASFPAALPPAPTELRGRREGNPFGGWSRAGELGRVASSSKLLASELRSRELRRWRGAAGLAPPV